MGPKKLSGSISNKQAFESIYYNQRCKLPPTVEDKLLDSFTDYCEETGSEELKITDLPLFLKKYLHISTPLIENIDTNDFLLSGTNDVVDFEKYLYQGALLLTLSKKSNSSVVDFYWKMLLRSCGAINDNTSSNQIFHKKFSLKDLSDSARSVNDDSPSSMLIGMMATGSRDGKPFVTYMDFAIILGRIGELEDIK